VTPVKFSDYFSLAFKSLKKRRLRAWLTILGILIGILAVVALISLGTGLRTAVIGQFGSLALDRLTIQNKGVGFAPPGSNVIKKLNDDDLRIIENTRGVKEAIPRWIRIIKLEYNDVVSFTYATDIPNDGRIANEIYESFNMELEEGKLLKGGDSGKVLIGYDISHSKSYGKILGVGRAIKINNKSFEVAGVLKKSSSFQLNGVVFLTSDDMENLLNIDDEYDLIIAIVEDENKIADVADELERKFRNDRNEKIGEETFSIETPLEALSSVNTILNIVNLIVIGIAAISLLVGGVGIANTMYTSVLERTKQIGTMKAIGAKNKDVLWIFLIESGLLGLIGGILGALFGLGAAIGISAIANNFLGNNLFSVSISYSLVILSILFSFLIGIVAGLLPALQASKLNIVDALRG
jgi:putative ABC transport system permease protein